MHPRRISVQINKSHHNVSHDRNTSTPLSRAFGASAHTRAPAYLQNNILKRERGFWPVVFLRYPAGRRASPSFCATVRKRRQNKKKRRPAAGEGGNGRRRSFCPPPWLLLLLVVYTRARELQNNNEAWEKYMQMKITV